MCKVYLQAAVKGQLAFIMSTQGCLTQYYVETTQWVPGVSLWPCASSIDSVLMIVSLTTFIPVFILPEWYRELTISSALLEIDSAFAVLGLRDLTISLSENPWLIPSEPRVETKVEPIFLAVRVRSG